MAKGERICTCCQGQYLYCPSCGIGDSKKTWMYAFCSENCRDLMQLGIEYSDNKIELSQAKEKLSTLDITNIENFKPGIKRYLTDILTNGTITSIATETMNVSVEEVAEEPIIEETSEIETEPVIEETNFFSRKSRRNRNRNVNEN